MVRHRSCFFRTLSLLILILVSFGLGCSLPLTPSVSTKSLKPDLSKQKIPLKASVIFSKQIEDLKVTYWIDKKGERSADGIINVKVGKSSVKLFKEAFRLLFEDVKFISEYTTLEHDEILVLPEIVEADTHLNKNRTYIVSQV